MAEEPALDEELEARLGAAPQILSSESIVVPPLGVSGAGAVAGAGGAARAGAAAGAELGRRLLLAARSGDAHAILDLMAQGAPFTTDWLGTSPLHLAAAGGHAQAAAVLLRAGVSRDARTKVDRTPLHLAAHAGHVAVALVLLDHGALLDCRDMLRMTPLHWACARGHASLAALLASRGADASARCKFRRTPLLLATEPRTRRALLAALRQRAAPAQPVTEEMIVEESPEICVESAPPQPAPLTDRAAGKLTHNIHKPDTDSERRQSNPVNSTPTAGLGNTTTTGGAAALLRQHGITLLPADDGSTVLSALQSGRTVVLSDAGKLMLKENSSPPASPAAVPSAAPAPVSSSSVCVGAAPVSGSSRNVLVRAWPARSPPRPGVKVFTVNKLTRAPTAVCTATATATTATATTGTAATTATTATTPVVRKILSPQDMQVKYVQLPPDATIISPSKTAMKAKSKVVRPVTSSGAAAGNKPGVKIIMNKASFSKLLATATRAHQSGDNEPLTGLSARGEAVVCVPEQFVRSMSARYLRAQLLAAHAALAALARELRAARALLPATSS